MKNSSNPAMYETMIPNRKTSEISTIAILLAVIPGSFLSHFSAGLVNIALTDITNDFQISLSLSQWIVTAYLLSVMIFLPIMGKLSDQFGRKTIHNSGYIFFGIGVLFSFLSHSIIYLLLSRILQGIGAAMLQSVNMVIITENVPTEKRVKALGLIGTSVGIGGLLGAPVGGILINWFSWNTLFLIQLPFVLCALIVAIHFIPSDPRGTKIRFDFIGASLFAFSITLIVFVLSQIGEGIFHLKQVVIVGIGLLSLFTFIRWIKRYHSPFIELSIFKHPIVKIGSCIIIGSYAACFATIVVLPFYLRGVLEYSTTASGLLLMIYPLFLSFFGPISGAISARIGSYKVVQIALLFMIAAFTFFAFLNMDSPMWTIIVILAVLGISMGLLTSPNYDLIMENIPAAFLGSIGGTIALLRNLGMVVGTALGISIVNFSAIVPVTKWLTLDNIEEQISILNGFTNVFILFICILVVLFIQLKIVGRKIPS
ncbi:MFS transporter [Lysinibacillus telephonicus]|uniref:MFS transporter n=1 Tax=Lysinibacillus telephonicus TaxID=1714840 RepID=A0A3S0JTE6_9BACI|nr:MFS transporter [Lysinibacillus telephonicus]RTQ90803.1 MFS transporter [Lysinibacillus telephonicus]